MNESNLRPKVVLWWGIALTVAGALLTILIPQIGIAAIVQPGSDVNVDQGILTVLEVVVRIIGQLVAPLGVALIGASLVMTYVGRLLAGRTHEAGRAPSIDP
ncbi:hypothetical protein ABCS02_30425 [Microbacterium sp. X-17]|uniref:hypothetical protein n=1 Tax=Microbacterium sp. X-17 TaxID=3144404 RepID=UPI0031F549F5